jgi:hypothetical protein
LYIVVVNWLEPPPIQLAPDDGSGAPVALLGGALPDDVVEVEFLAGHDDRPVDCVCDQLDVDDPVLATGVESGELADQLLDAERLRVLSGEGGLTSFAVRKHSRTRAVLDRDRQSLGQQVGIRFPHRNAGHDRDFIGLDIDQDLGIHRLGLDQGAQRAQEGRDRIPVEGELELRVIGVLVERDFERRRQHAPGDDYRGPQFGVGECDVAVEDPLCLADGIVDVFVGHLRIEESRGQGHYPSVRVGEGGGEQVDGGVEIDPGPRRWVGVLDISIDHLHLALIGRVGDPFDLPFGDDFDESRTIDVVSEGQDGVATGKPTQPPPELVGNVPRAAVGHRDIDQFLFADVECHGSGIERELVPVDLDMNWRGEEVGLEGLEPGRRCLPIESAEIHPGDFHVSEDFAGIGEPVDPEHDGDQRQRRSGDEERQLERTGNVVHAEKSSVNGGWG